MPSQDRNLPCPDQFFYAVLAQEILDCIDLIGITRNLKNHGLRPYVNDLRPENISDLHNFGPRSRR